ncbi:hypothetical protein VTN96DRAFT_5354 [Rasamsonia emersonii]
MTLLEIERKFAFHPALLSQFRRNGGAPPFTHLQHLGSQKFHDIYFDGKRDILARHGIWVRQRNGVWQAKQRVQNHCDKKGEHTGSSREDVFLRTVFNEISCPREIHALVTRYVPSGLSFPSADCNFGLQPIANFTTSRETFLADERFHVVLDETCFGHRVGEVELLAERGEEQHAQLEIDRFMERYRWFFLSCGNNSVKGKLSAHFERFPVSF